MADKSWIGQIVRLF